YCTGIPMMKERLAMARYVFIESRDPFESNDTQFVTETVTALKQLGHQVTVFLIQNGALAARRNARVSHLRRLAAAGVELLADDFSLRERGVTAAEMGDGIRESNIEALVDLLIQEETKAIWH
ncbi:MAG: DsrE family protein, partial [Blastocatellia bacterium]